MQRRPLTAVMVTVDMAQFQVYTGHAPERFSQQLQAQPNWQLLPYQETIFAYLPNSRCDYGEQSTLFCSPDSLCAGVFSGKLFDFDRLTKDYGSDLTPAQKLGVLLQSLYAKQGVNFPLQLQGFFGIIFKVDGKLLAVRDAIGERPLYYLQTNTGMLLADRLSVLMSYPECSRQINPAGVADFLSTGFSPFSRTPVAGINKLEPGVTASISPTGATIFHYHRLHDQIVDISEQQSVGLVQAALASAVSNRLESNAKTGLLLSGGLDSSLVGALVGGANLTAAYSLNFGPEYRNELEFSGLMAKHLGIPARVITVSPKMVKAKFLATARILDEPIGDPLTVPNVIVAEAAATEVQLVFNGEGGDPVFGGPKNLPIMAFEAYSSGMPELTRETMYLMAYNKGHEHLPTLLSEDYQQQLKNYPSAAELLAPLLNDSHFSSYLHRLMHINLRLKGGAQILPKVLKASAAAGLAVRSPLFDQRLAELAFSLPPAMKLNGPVEKYILKQAVKHCVPATIIERPKSGMLVPVHFWFNKELKAFAKAVLLDRHAKIAKLVKHNALLDLIEFKGGGIRPYYGDRLWLLLSLELWMQAHNISAGL